jgi:hypothetical protein
LPAKGDREPYYDKFALVVSELSCLAGRYARLLRPVDRREETGNLGVLLQILVSQEIVDRVCYLSAAYGIPLKTSESPHEAFKRIREKPDDHREMQVRILAQSLLIPDYQIKVFLHGYADFFSVTPETLKMPSGMSKKDEQRLMQTVVEKEKCLQAMQDLLFLAMVSTHKSTAESVAIPAAPLFKKTTSSKSKED